MKKYGNEEGNVIGRGLLRVIKQEKATGPCLLIRSGCYYPWQG
jgi:hypothetical protein